MNYKVFNIIKYSLPLSISQSSGPFSVAILISMLGLVDVIYLNQFIIVLSIFALVFALTTLIFSGVQNLSSEAYGDEQELFNLFYSGMALVIFVIVMSTIITFIIPIYIYDDYELERLHKLMIVTVPFVILNAFITFFLEGAGHAPCVSKIKIVDVILQLIISTVFIFKSIVVNPVEAVIFAFIISDIIVCFLLFYTLNKMGINLNLSVLHFSKIREILKIGLPISLGVGLSKLFVSVVTLLLSYTALTNSSSYGILVSIMFILLIPVVGLGMSCSIFYSRNLLGKESQSSFFYTISIGVVYSSFISLVWLNYHQYIVSIFTYDEGVAEAVSQVSSLVAMLIVLMSGVLIILPYLRSQKDILVPQFVNSLIPIIILSIYLICYAENVSLGAVLYLQVISLTVINIFLLFRVNQKPSKGVPWKLLR